MSQNFKLQNDELISVGNDCLILDTSRDYFNYLRVNNPKAKEIVLEHVISYNIVDIYMYIENFIQMIRGILGEHQHI